MTRLARAFLIGSMIINAPVWCAAAEGQTRLQVGTVHFAGNTAFPETRLVGLLLMRPSGFLRSTRYYPEVFADDIDNVVLFYRQQGYLEAAVVDTQVAVDSARARVDIKLRVQEGELTTVEGTQIFGNSVFADSLLCADVDLRPGLPFRRSRVQSAMVKMLSRYAERGYLDAVIRPDIRLNPERHLAMLDFTITENRPVRLARIRIEGLTKTRPAVVHRELSLAPGDLIRYSALIAAQKRLYLTGLFQSVFVRAVPPQEGGADEKDVLIELSEGPSSEFNVSLGFGSVDKIRGRTEILTNNLAGTARKTSLALSASFVRRAAEAAFTEPRTFGLLWRTDINLLLEYLEQPGYNLGRVGGRLTFGRAFTRTANIAFAYRYENGTLKDIKVMAMVQAPDTRIRSLSATLTRDDRDNLFDPTRGTYFEWTNEIAGSFLQGSNTFARSIVRLKAFALLNRATVLGAALELGWMDFFGASDAVPLSERFYTGGPGSLRGFQLDRVGPRQADGVPLGGKFKIVWNVAEIRRALYRMIGAALFVDIGNVWTTIGDFDLRDVRFDIGTGLRASTPIGILRLDYSVNVDRQPGEPRGLLYFSMGQAF